MSKKNKEIENLERQIRTLKQTNRQLAKVVKKFNKGYYKYLIDEELAKDDGYEENVAKASKPKEPEKVCWTCGKGKLQKVEILGRYYRTCPVCFYRTKAKPLE